MLFYNQCGIMTKVKSSGNALQMSIFIYVYAFPSLKLRRNLATALHLVSQFAPSLCSSKESRMNGQYQQTVDPFNNDNK